MLSDEKERKNKLVRKFNVSVLDHTLGSVVKCIDTDAVKMQIP